MQTNRRAFWSENCSVAIPKGINTKCSSEAHLVIRNVIKHLLDLCWVFHMGGDWVGGAEGVHLHGFKTLP